MNTNYRDYIYGNYMSTGFGIDKRMKNIDKEFKTHTSYFKKNYLSLMPADRKKAIADLGCGMGHFLVFCKKYGYNNVIGVDVSSENIAFCKTKKLNVIEDGIENFLDNNINTFDCIIFNDVIEHLKKNETIDVLLKLQKSLKKNGTVLIKTPNMANPYVSTTGRYIDFTHEIGYTEYSIKQVLLATGFRNVEVKGTDIYVFKSPVNFIAKAVAKIFEGLLFLFSYLYGRKSIKIFTKDILAIAYKE